MSSQPQRQDDPQSLRKDTALLLDALKSDADASRRLREADQRIEQVRALGALEIVYTWYTPDDREADVRVFYLDSEEPELLASRLVRIDYREPTAQERVRYEEQFDDQVSEGGELWSEVASFIWGK